MSEELRADVAKPDDRLAMTTLYQYAIPNEYLLDFWGYCSLQADWWERPIYARLGDEIRGYAAGGHADAPVPGWAKALLSRKYATKTPSVVRGRVVPGSGFYSSIAKLSAFGGRDQ